MDRLAVGYVARAHGVRGELRIHLHEAGSETLYDVDEVWIGGVAYPIVSARPTTGATLLAVEGIEDRDAADALRGQPVEVAREAVPLDENEFFLADLPGMEVVDVEGRPIGRVDRVISGPQDLIAIHDDRVERLLPVVPELVLEVDTSARRIVVELPEDLPEDPLPSRKTRG